MIETNSGGFPVGHSYGAIVTEAKKDFPDSRVDKKHVTWYAHKMREMGEMIPVYRERSKWK